MKTPTQSHHLASHGCVDIGSLSLILPLPTSPPPPTQYYVSVTGTRTGRFSGSASWCSNHITSGFKAWNITLLASNRIVFSRSELSGRLNSPFKINEATKCLSEWSHDLRASIEGKRETTESTASSEHPRVDPSIHVLVLSACARGPSGSQPISYPAQPSVITGLLGPEVWGQARGAANLE